VAGYNIGSGRHRRLIFSPDVSPRCSRIGDFQGSSLTCREAPRGRRGAGKGGREGGDGGLAAVRCGEPKRLRRSKWNIVIALGCRWHGGEGRLICLRMCSRCAVAAGENKDGPEVIGGKQGGGRKGR
jgi:hypothetical protein